jgi:hypothetical protein
MNIESLEVSLFKASEIQNGDIILVRMGKEEKNKLTKDNVQSLYKQINAMIKKENIQIYFFPKDISIDLIKKHVETLDINQNKIEASLNEN